MKPIIEARNLTKHYGRFVAVGGIDFVVWPQECFGILGPNGAGKSSTIRMVCCTSPVTTGLLAIDGYQASLSPREIRQRIGVVPQEDNLDTDLTVIQNLLAHARYFGMPGRLAIDRARSLLDLFQLRDAEKAEIDELSGGMKRRLIISRSLVHDPDILILDEPTTGLDPQAKHMVWQNIRALKQDGKSILLTTHNMEEATDLCDRLIIMDKGLVVAEGKPTDLIKLHAGKEVTEVRPSSLEYGTIIERLRRAEVLFQNGGDRLYLFGAQTRSIGNQIGLPDDHISVRPANLEDVFFILTGRDLQNE
ncbi:MAG: ATP-binding cassette domain-containing protein [Chloroflexota bacterium]|nr:ATP-binding cassette domain-containing protein [Chloroflexota bacterium]